MAKKKNITKDGLIDLYMNHVLEHHEVPTSVFKFAKDNGFEESQFYDHYGSFEGLQTDVFTTFFNNTHALLEKSEDYHNYDPQNKLLSFYYTFFEMLSANRSYVVYALKEHGHKLSTLKQLSGLRKAFKAYVDGLGIEKLDLKQEQLEKIQDQAISESAWMQLLFTMKFWLEDTSSSFEKTDVFIEKSVKASFDLMNLTPVKSVLDLGKFLFKEKMAHS